MYISIIVFVVVDQHMTWVNMKKSNYLLSWEHIRLKMGGNVLTSFNNLTKTLCCLLCPRTMANNAVVVFYFLNNAVGKLCLGFILFYDTKINVGIPRLLSYKSQLCLWTDFLFSYCEIVFVKTVSCKAPITLYGSWLFHGKMSRNIFQKGEKIFCFQTKIMSQPIVTLARSELPTTYIIPFSGLS